MWSLARAAASLLLLQLGLSVTMSAGAPAAAPALSLSPGSLEDAARNPPSGTSVCRFFVQGGPETSSTTVTTSSIDESSVGVGLRAADIECSGGSENITIQGGPALESFSAGWQGVSYVKNIQLPGSTMTLRGAQMVVQDSVFAGLQSFGSSAIAFADSNVTFLNTTFVLNNNSAAGCIYANESSLVTILDSNFTNNAGLSAGSVALWNSSLTVNNTAFTNNTCNSQGGAIMVSNGTNLIVSQSNFTRNNGTNGGAIYFEICREANVTQNMFVRNQAVKSGGAMFQLKCPGTFLSNTFMQNNGSNGGSIWHNNIKSVNHTLNLFVNNIGSKGSGGIELNQVDSFSVSSCNFTGGRGSKGGAIYTQNVAGNIVNTYFARNNASTSGGAIFRGTSSGSIEDCSFIGNYAASDGGAIYDSHVSGDITNNTFDLATSRNGSVTGIFRTVSSGDISSNEGLPSDEVSNQQPATTG